MISLLNEIHYLNKLVVKYCGKEVGSNVLQYQGYIKDLENPDDMVKETLLYQGIRTSNQLREDYKKN